jgi:hypothetical protein
VRSSKAVGASSDHRASSHSCRGDSQVPPPCLPTQPNPRAHHRLHSRQRAACKDDALAHICARAAMRCCVDSRRSRPAPPAAVRACAVRRAQVVAARSHALAAHSVVRGICRPARCGRRTQLPLRRERLQVLLRDVDGAGLSTATRQVHNAHTHTGVTVHTLACAV